MSPHMMLGTEQFLNFNNSRGRFNPMFSMVFAMCIPAFPTLFPLRFKWVRCLHKGKYFSISVQSSSCNEQFGRHNRFSTGSDPMFFITSTRCFPWFRKSFSPRSKIVSNLHLERLFKMSPHMLLGTEQSLKHNNLIGGFNPMFSMVFAMCIPAFPTLFPSRFKWVRCLQRGRYFSISVQSSSCNEQFSRYNCFSNGSDPKRFITSARSFPWFPKSCPLRSKNVSNLHWDRLFKMSPHMLLGIEQFLNFNNSRGGFNPMFSMVFAMCIPAFPTLFPSRFKWVRCLHKGKYFSISVQSSSCNEQFGRYNHFSNVSDPTFFITSARSFPWFPKSCPPRSKIVSNLHWERLFKMSPHMLLGTEQSLKYNNLIGGFNPMFSMVFAMCIPAFPTLFPLRFKRVRCLHKGRNFSISVQSSSCNEQFGRYKHFSTGSDPKFFITSTRSFPWFRKSFSPRSKNVSNLHLERLFKMSPHMFLGIEQSLNFNNSRGGFNPMFSMVFAMCIPAFPTLFPSRFKWVRCLQRGRYFSISVQSSSCNEQFSRYNHFTSALDPKFFIISVRSFPWLPRPNRIFFLLYNVIFGSFIVVKYLHCCSCLIKCSTKLTGNVLFAIVIDCALLLTISSSSETAWDASQWKSRISRSVIDWFWLILQQVNSRSFATEPRVS